MEFLLLLILIVMLIAWLCAINLFVEAARKKGYYCNGGSGILWFIGIFATPIVVGIYVSALPDRSTIESRGTVSEAKGFANAHVAEDLPAV